MQTGLSAACGVDSALYPEMIQHMYLQAASIGEALGWRGKDLANLSSEAGVLAAAGISDNRRWPLKDEENEEERRERLRARRG